VSFKFRKIDGPRPVVSTAHDAPSPAASAVSTMPAALDSTSPTSKILRLLRVLHDLAIDAVETKVDEQIFVNNKLTAKLTRQLEETMILARYDECPRWQHLLTCAVPVYPIGQSSYPNTFPSCSPSKLDTLSSNPPHLATLDCCPRHLLRMQTETDGLETIYLTWPA
jgi:hypothetical protein